LKIQYVCECCGEVVDETEVAPRPGGGLTGGDARGIIGLESGSEKVLVEVLCADCYETLYGASGPSFYSGPVLH